MVPLRKVAMERTITLDAGFFFVEHENVPMHLGSLALFEGPAPAYGDLVRLFAAKLPLVPRYRQVVRTTPLHIFRPAWADDEHFEIGYHLRHAAVPKPGGDDQLPVGAQILTEMLGFAAPTLLALGSRAAFSLPQPLVQTVTTNVPGPRFPLYILGRRMEGAYPYVPIGDNVRISVAIFSYLDQFSFGITADYDAVTDLDVLAEGIGLGVAELADHSVAARRVTQGQPQRQPCGKGPGKGKSKRKPAREHQAK
jgi:hypothetical protein